MSVLVGSPSRTARKITEAVARLRLELSGRHVLTEAATGHYAVTPVIAACAGASVTALAKDSRHGTAARARQEVLDLAAELGVAERIDMVETLTGEQIARADVITNSGHLRPIDARMVGAMTPGTVVPLMYESWELRPGEIDVQACRRQGVIVAGTNERHEDVRVFDYLGSLAVAGLLRCGVPVAMSKLLLICDNPFRPYILRTLLGCGAAVEVHSASLVPKLQFGNRRESLSGPQAPAGSQTGVWERGDFAPRDDYNPPHYDAVIVADTPTDRPILGRSGEAKYSVEQFGRFDAVVQLWGDVDRDAIGDAVCCPADAPPPGHMGLLLSELGSEPIVRLQAAGLKVAEELTGASADAVGPDGRPQSPYVDAVLTPQRGNRK